MSALPQHLPHPDVAPVGVPTGARIGALHLHRLVDGWQNARGPGYVVLAERLRTLVLDGRLAVGTLLPSERDLATATGTSRTTTSAAYRRLRETGFADSRQGAGTWVTLPGDRPEAPAQERPWLGGAAVEPNDADEPLLSMAAPGAPSALYPAYTAALAELPRYLHCGGYVSQGLAPLRERIASRYVARGVATLPEQILVTAGAAQGTRLAVEAVVTPGMPVLVEHPTWPPLLDAVRVCGGRAIPLPVEDGWDAAQVARLVRASRARAACLMVDGQNPTGRILTGQARLDLAETLARVGLTVVVDETLAELDLRTHLGIPSHEAAPAFAGLAPHRHGEVLSVGSASKTFWGGLRVGWVRAGTSTIRRLTLARVADDLAGSVLDQLTVAHLLDGIDDVLARRRPELAANCRGLQDLLERHLPGWVAPDPDAGLVLWCRLPAPASTAIALSARRHGLTLTAGSRFAVGGGIESRIRLPFARPAADLEPHVVRLAAAVRDVGDAGAADLTDDVLPLV